LLSTKPPGGDSSPKDPKSAELIKPWLRGRDIRKGKAQWAGLYVINHPKQCQRKWPWSGSKEESEALRLFDNTYPAVYRHLFQMEKTTAKT
jgi:hypothetical protein